MEIKKVKYYFLLAAVVSIFLFNSFYNLNREPIEGYDEARHGVSAYEMVKNGNFFVNTYGYEYDYWNLKPPLSFWAIYLGYRITGFNVLGLRLLSALAGLGTLLVVVFLVRFKHGYTASIISAVVLTTTLQYITFHCVRTGDADSLYVFFFTLSMASLAMVTHNNKYLYLSGISMSLAFLTKSWHAISITIIIVFFLLLFRNRLNLKFKQLFMFSLLTFLPVTVWIVYRYKNDGLEFFINMIKYDLLKRSNQTIEGHIGGMAFYADILHQYYGFWLMILFGGLLSILIIIHLKRMEIDVKYITLIILWIFVPLFAYTVVHTKIAWYILPLYPAFAVCIGASYAVIINYFRYSRYIYFFVILSLMIPFTRYELKIRDTITKVRTDKVQTTFEKMAGLGVYRGSAIYSPYIDRNNPYRWYQNHMLAAEIYADLVPKKGGVSSFLNDGTNALILLPKQIASKFIQKYNLKIVVESPSHLILSK